MQFGVKLLIERSDRVEEEQLIAVHKNANGEIISFKTSNGRIISYRKALMEAENGQFSDISLSEGDNDFDMQAFSGLPEIY